MSLSGGVRLGPYEIVAPLGEGGMGEVYRARDTRLDRVVAVKVLRSDIAGDGDLRARFEREARAVAALEHPHICGIYDVGGVDGTHYLVMPHLEGQTLAARLEKGPLPLDQALKIATEIADALDKAHRQGIVHRDLKPANIMLTKAGSKLLDFGLAKLRSSGPISMSEMTRVATSAPSTARGTILGTVPYMAPEQVEGKDADARTDIWALGAVLYEMVTGGRPFSGDSPASVIGSILKDDPPPVSARQPLAPKALDRLVAVCLAKDPDNRWQSSADVGRQLAWVADADEAKKVSNVPARRRGLTLAATAVVAAVVGGASVWLLRGASASSPFTTDAPIALAIEAPPGLTFVGPAASMSVPQFAVSPDGRHVVFAAADAEGRTSLWVRALGDPQSRPLRGTERATDPFWAPDSRRVGFFAQGLLKRTSIDDTVGSPQVVAKTPVDTRGAAWNTDETILFYAGRPSLLSRVSAAGGPVADLSIGNDVGMLRWPQFLPGGRHLLFQVRHEDPNRRGAFVRALAEPSAGSGRLIGTDWAARYASGYVLFLDASTLMAQPFDITRFELSGTPSPIARGVGGSSTGYGAFSVSTTGVLAYTGGLFSQSELRWVARSGRAGDVVAPRGDYVDLNLSPDQSRVAYSLVDAQSQAPDIWILDFVRGTSAKITAERLMDASAVWSPGGEQIVFRSNRSSTIGVELFMTSSSPGGSTRRIYGFEDVRDDVPSNLVPYYWSRDGQVVFSQSTMNAGYGIWITSIDRKSTRTIVDTPHNELQAAISPDGRWMAYASDLSGRYEIYVQALAAGAEGRLVSTGGGMQPQWRGDGRELYYVRADGMLMQVTVTTGTRFDADAPTALFQTGFPTVLNPYRTDYVPASDGQRFLMKVPVRQAPPSIMVVLNWPALLAATDRRQ